MAHPTEAELRKLGNDILDLLVQKTIEENDSRVQARRNQIQEEYGMPLEEIPPNQRPPMESGAQMEAEIEDYIREAYAWLPDTYAEFAQPRPEEFDPLIEKCATTLMLLQPSMKNPTRQGEAYAPVGNASDVAADFPTSISERVTDVQGQVVEWEGTAANAFNQHYLNQYPDSLRYQHDAVFGLTASMEANREIFKRVGTDIVQIGEKTKEALRHVTDKDVTGEVIAFTVVGAVASVAAAAVTGGAAAIVILSGVAAAGGAASDIIGAVAPEPYDAEIEGATTQQIMVSMTERISDLYRFIDEQETKIVNALSRASGFVEQNRKEIELPLPEGFKDLGDAPGNQIEDGFNHP